MPSSIALSTMLTVSSSRVRARCARTSPTARRHRHRAQRRRRRRMVGQRKEPGNERSTSRPARPRGSTRTSRARRCVRLVAVTPRRARAPPVDYGDDLSFPGDNCPTNLRPNHCTQRCPHARLEMDRGMTARDQGYKCSRSSELRNQIEQNRQRLLISDLVSDVDGRTFKVLRHAYLTDTFCDRVAFCCQLTSSKPIVEGGAHW